QPPVEHRAGRVAAAAQLVAGGAVVVLAAVDALDDTAVRSQVFAALDVSGRGAAARPVQGEQGPEAPQQQRGEKNPGLGAGPARTAEIGDGGWHGVRTTLGRRPRVCNSGPRLASVEA